MILTVLSVWQPPERAGTDRLPDWPDDVTVRSTRLTDLGDWLSRDNYRAIALDDLRLLLPYSAGTRLPRAVSDQPSVTRAVYEAELTPAGTLSGRLQFHLDNRVVAERGGLVELGITSLQTLAFERNGTPLRPGSDAAGRFFVRVGQGSSTLDGTWLATGSRIGTSTVFRMDLPRSTVSELRLSTPWNVEVTCNNALVLGPRSQPGDDAADSGDRAVWTLVPNIPGRITVSCRESLPDDRPKPLVLNSVTAAHTVSGDTLQTRWTIGLAQSGTDPAALLCGIPSRVRITDVRINDTVASDWSVTDQAGQQMLRVALPRWSGVTTVSLQAASLLSDQNPIVIPFLVPQRWFPAASGERPEATDASAGESGGAVLFPASTVTLTIPPSMRLESWELDGVVERDVTVVPDGTQTFQLTRVDPSPTALAHVSVAAPQVTDAVLVMMPGVDRSSTVRCLVRAECRESATVQLEWPVGAGWRPLAVRYASNSRLLYFEQLPAVDEQSRSRLVVHLTEALEPDTSRLLELEFQQFGSTGLAGEELPLPANPDYTRQTSAWIRTASTTAPADLSRRYASAVEPVSRDQLLTAMPWIPESVVPNDSRGILWTGADPVLRDGVPDTVDPGPGSPDSDVDRVIADYRAVIADYQLVETTTLDIPFRLVPAESTEMRLRLAPVPDIVLTCVINDTPCEITARGAADPIDSGWQEWSVPIPGQLMPGPLTVRVTGRRPLRSDLQAAIALPVAGIPVNGTAEFQSTPSTTLQPVGGALIRLGDSLESRAADDLGVSSTWSLPAEPEPFTLSISDAVSLQQKRDTVHVWHLIRLKDRVVSHRSLAVIETIGRAEPASLPLQIATSDVIAATVNGRNVDVLVSDEGATLPLPASDTPVTIGLLWETNVPTGFRRTSTRLDGGLRLPRDAFASHALLIDPELIATPPRGPWTTYGMLAGETLLQDAVPNLTRQGDRTHPFQSFVSDWRLSLASDWQPLSSAQHLQDAAGLSLPLTAVRSLSLIRSLAGAVAALIMLCIVQSGRGRLAACVILVAAVATRSLTTMPPLQWGASGVFWGTTLVLLWLVCRRSAQTPLVRIAPSSVMSTAAAVCVLLLSPAVAAQPPATDSDTTPVDVILPSERIEGIPLAYVRDALLRDWEAARQSSTAHTPRHLILAAETVVRMNGATDISAELRVTVDVRTDDDQHWLHLQTHDASLQACAVDGQTVLPMRTRDTDGRAQLAIPLSPGVVVAPLPLAAGASPPESGEAPAVSESAVTESAASEAAVAAAGLPGWQTREIVLNLRPTVAETPDGLTLRLPAPPCPGHRVQIEAGPELLHSALLESGDSLRVWHPESPATVRLESASVDGFRVTLRRAGRAVGNEPAAARCAAISELISGQHTITLLFQVAGLDPASPPLEIPIPDDYRVAAISPSQPPEIQWTVEGRRVRLPNAVSALAGRVLAVQFVRDRPAELNHHTVAIGQIVEDLSIDVRSPVLLAVRTLPEMIVQSVESAGDPIPATTDIPDDFSSYIRRTDLLFEVAADAPPVLVRQTLRRAVSEARVRHEVVLRDDACDVRVHADIETSVQFVFRHRLRIPADMVVRSVAVTAGEANRLQSWSQSDDILVVQLKEATSGLHNLTLEATLPTPQTDEPLPVRPPEWIDIQVLESDLTLTDQSTRGFRIEELGAAVPEEPMDGESQLPRGVSVRLQLVAESDPLVVRPIQQAADPAADAEAAHRRADGDRGDAAATESGSADSETSQPPETRNGSLPEMLSTAGRAVAVSWIGLSDNQAAFGATHLIVCPASGSADFTIRIPSSLQVLETRSDARVQTSPDGRVLTVGTSSIAAELTLHWVIPGDARVPLLLDTTLEFPHVPGMATSHLVSVTAPTTLRDDDGSLVRFRASAPELTGIERDSQLRLLVSEALTTADRTAEPAEADDQSTAELLRHVDAVRSRFITESTSGSGVPPDLRHFRLTAAGTLHVHAVRVPGLVDLVAVLVTMTLTGIVSLLEVKRRQRLQQVLVEGRPQPIAADAPTEAQGAQRREAVGQGAGGDSADQTASDAQAGAGIGDSAQRVRSTPSESAGTTPPRESPSGDAGPHDGDSSVTR